MKRYGIREFAKLIDVNPQTLRNWDKHGKLKPDYVNPDTGYRYYSEDQLEEQVGRVKKDKIVVGYCRVSSKKQRSDLERQVESVQNYLIAQGKPFRIIQDIGSGIEYDRKGLTELIKLIVDKKISKIVVLYKDRLAQFAFDLIETICNENNVDIEVIDNSEKTEQEEIVDDLVQIIRIFSCRLQGERSKKTRKLLKELVQNG